MQVLNYVQEVEQALEACRMNGKTIGFVPTMGALHKGHLSLVRLARNENDFVIVSIFVNPTQFNNKDDLKNYPRNLQADLELLEPEKANFVFAPSVDEVYPEKNLEETKVDLGFLEKTMEGKHRPGHFNGVVQVVSRLFDIVKCDRAYFGEKDFQQLAVIREMTKQLGLPVQIRSCPTVRDSDGLAMSSRNTLLDPAQRKSAAGISKALFYIRDNWNQMSPDELREEAISRIEKDGMMKVEYLEVADAENLQPLIDRNQSNHARVFAAVQVGKVRLIDNVALPPSINF